MDTKAKRLDFDDPEIVRRGILQAFYIARCKANLAAGRQPDD
jgi:hypothetical protein